MKIIIDAMGGDNAPDEIIKGAVQAVQEFGVPVILVGDGTSLLEHMRSMGYANLPKGIEIAHASEVVEMTDEGSAVLRTKKDSSLVVGLKLLKAGEGDAFVSAGNTGALLVCSTLMIGRVRGIKRAAITAVLPTAKGRCVLIDSGANVETTPSLLLQFAYMGSFYAEHVLEISNPTVGLLNNGTEETKGPPVQKEAYALLREAARSATLNFIGNIEARDVPAGGADVVAADGFSGNILMKAMEGTAYMLTGMLKSMFVKNIFTKLSALALRGSLAEFKSRLDYKEVGGAPLLGIAKPVLKAHGSSDARAVRSAVNQAIKYAEADISSLIAGNIGLMAAEK